MYADISILGYNHVLQTTLDSQGLKERNSGFSAHIVALDKLFDSSVKVSSVHMMITKQNNEFLH